MKAKDAKVGDLLEGVKITSIEICGSTSIFIDLEDGSTITTGNDTQFDIVSVKKALDFTDSKEDDDYQFGMYLYNPVTPSETKDD